MTVMRTRAAAAIGSAAFFLIGPGVEAGLAPWLITGWEAGDWPAAALPLRVAGGVVLLAAVAVLVHAFVRFAREGLGTPAPVAPPDRLVVGGAYRHVRNPMYVASTAAIAGQGLLLARPVLLACAAAFCAAMAFFVRRYEEPLLRRRFGSDYDAYRRAVPGWWPRLRAWEAA